MRSTRLSPAACRHATLPIGSLYGVKVVGDDPTVALYQNDTVVVRRQRGLDAGRLAVVAVPPAVVTDLPAPVRRWHHDHKAPGGVILGRFVDDPDGFYPGEYNPTVRLFCAAGMVGPLDPAEVEILGVVVGVAARMPNGLRGYQTIPKTAQLRCPDHHWFLRPEACLLCSSCGRGHPYQPLPPTLTIIS